MTLVIKSTHPNFIIRNLSNLVHKIAVKTPSFENLRDFGRLYKFSNENAWAQINAELKLYRFSASVPKNDFMKEYQLSDFERFRPILLIHGYQSNHISWNWLVLQLWEDGFRQIYALEMADYRRGFDYNMQQLTEVIKFILDFQINYKKIDIIAHSMGGLVTRQYLKLNQGALYVRLFIAMGSPFKGVFKFWGLMASFDEAQESANDITDKNKLDIINDAQYEQSFYLLTQINIIGSMRRYFNTDGLFKNYPLPDMINFTIPTTHFNLNKTDKSYNIIKRFLFKESWLFKIRLLSIHKTDILLASSSKNLFSLSVSVRFQIRVKDSKTLVLRDKGYFPTIDRDELYFEINQPFIPDYPVIIYSGMGIEGLSELIEISLLYNENYIASASATIDRSQNSENVDYLSFKAIITELDISIQSNFAITRYILE